MPDAPTLEPDPGRTAAKQAMRAVVVAAREAMSDQQRAAAAQELARVAVAAVRATGAGTVAAYASVGREPGTRPLLAALLADGVDVLLPLLRADLGLDWAVYAGPERLRAARHGLVEPDGPRLPPDALGRADAVLVPALAVDDAGHRLGRGAGCYDRALRHARPGAPVWVVLHDGEVLAEVPADAHDRPVDGALLPSGLRPVRPAG